MEITEISDDLISILSDTDWFSSLSGLEKRGVIKYFVNDPPEIMNLEKYQVKNTKDKDFLSRCVNKRLDVKRVGVKLFYKYKYPLKYGDKYLYKIVYK